MSKPKLEKNIVLPENLLKDLLTPSEIRMLKNRWLIIQHLQAGLSVRAISEKVKVGTDTVVRVSRMLGKNNSLKSTTSKLSQNKTSWIFGKSD
ncbi:MAG: Trp family transcriptional regulator [Candidatus Daviesbacteria bacterium]|nr:Trp family transcriptional regulator [Candidatus Daviesbacteria bacterium]